VADPLRDEDYRELLLLRAGLRRFLHQSETWAHEAGLTPAQRQLLLAIRGHDVKGGPTIGDVAGYLFLRHHSAVELVDRAVSAGLVVRNSDPHDARAVRLALTKAGASALARLSARNRNELTRLADHFRPLWEDLNSQAFVGPSGSVRDRISVGRVYDPIDSDGRHILVDRLWPRGLAKNDITLEWRKHLAPSTELRRWYHHDPGRFEEFAREYTKELNEHTAELRELVASSEEVPLVLLTATKDVERSAAAVLADALRTGTAAQRDRKRRSTH